MEDIKSHYKDLLIYQYKGQPKAEAMVDLIADIYYNDNILQDIQDAFFIDTAIGQQLDYIGKVVGIDRNYFGAELKEGVYFAISLEPQDQTTSEKSFQLDIIDGTIVNDTSFASDSNILNDDEFRFLIKLKIIYNNTDCSMGAIDDALYQYFGNEVQMTSGGDMTMQYWITSQNNKNANIAKRKGVFPKPAGVHLNFIITQDLPLLAFTLEPQDATEYYKGFQLQPVDGNILLNTQIIS
jgi:hypothetical protein